MASASTVSLAVVLCSLLNTQAASAQDIVLHSTDLTAVRGNWTRVDSSSGASSQKVTSGDWGYSANDQPAAYPNDYFEATFSAPAWVPYRVWLRMRSVGNSKWNDSVWVQLSDSNYGIGTNGGLLYNLEACYGCGLSEWGWNGGAWWLPPSTVQFFSDGPHTIRIQTREDGVEIDQIVLSPSNYLYSAPGSTLNDSTILPRSSGGTHSGSGGGGGGTTSGAFGGTAWAIPGTIQAEDFDQGGEGAGYHDTSAGNTGGAYRATDVDIAVTGSGGYTVGWAGAGEWLQYTVNVAAGGTYTIIGRVASAGSGGTFHIEFNGQDKTGALRVPDTGGWDTYQDVSASVYLEAGVQTMRLKLDTDGITGAVGNFSSFRFETAGSAPPPTSPSSSAFGGSPAAIPGTIQFEDFDHGGPSVSYLDFSPGNAGGAYRATDVDIAATSGGGYTVGWAGAGEWLHYTVNVTAAGNYTVTLRVASAGPGGVYHIELNGADKTGGLSVPDTGGWDAYRDVSTTVWLDAGVQTMRLALDTNGPANAVGNFEHVRFEPYTAPAPAPAPTPAPPPTQSGGGTVRVMTWNIHFGNGDTWGQAYFIANTGADVVLLQEAQTWDEDMRRTYVERLRQITGHNWQSAWGGAGALCDSGCQGTLILSKYPILDSGAAEFEEIWAGRARIDVGGVHLNVFNIHLHAYDTGRRTSQLLQIMDWARPYAGPRILGGDFNAWWDEWWIHQTETEYSDTWRDVTGGIDGGFTIGNVRFDYLFRAYDSNWRLTPYSVWVEWTSLSDHHPVIADYTIR